MTRRSRSGWLAGRWTAVVVVVVLVAAGSSACSSPGPDGSEAMVFSTSPQPGLDETDWVGAGIVTDYGLPLFNITGNRVRLLGMSLVSPRPSRTVRLIGFYGYRLDETRGWTTVTRGALWKDCPGYTPRPINHVVVAAHASKPWYLVAVLRLLEPGRYHLLAFRIRYEVNGQPGWQQYWMPITVIVVPRGSDPGYFKSDGC